MQSTKFKDTPVDSSYKECIGTLKIYFFKFQALAVFSSTNPCEVNIKMPLGLLRTSENKLKFILIKALEDACF